MKFLIMSLMTLLSVNSFADSANDYLVKTDAKKVVSFSTEGLVELYTLKVKYAEEDDEGNTRVKTVSALVNAGDSENAATLLLAKQNGWKVSIVYDPEEDVEEYEDSCYGYSSYLVTLKDYEGDKYTACYVVSPSEIIVH